MYTRTLNPHPDSSTLTVRTAPRLRTVNTARILASCHIVIGHLYQKKGALGGEMSCIYFFAWGYSRCLILLPRGGATPVDPADAGRP
jgi:hypothetical protein